MNAPDPKHPPTVVVLSSHVARGSVGNRALVPALEALGLRVWVVPTVTLPWHPGHGPGTRMVPDEKMFRALLDDLASSEFIGEVDAILSGYLCSPEQVMAVCDFVKAVQSKRDGVQYVCDPVIGDEKGLYVSEAVAKTIRNTLLPITDLITPNRFEYSWLVDEVLGTNDELVRSFTEQNIHRALITSAFGMLKNSTANLYVDDEQAWLAEHRQFSDAPNGTGDLTAGLFVARLLQGMSCEKALQVTTQSVFELLTRTSQRGADELTIEQDLGSLVRPKLPVQMRRIAVGLPRKQG